MSDPFSNLMPVISAIPKNVYWKDVDLKYRGCNAANLKSFGYDTIDDIIGKTDHDLFEAEYAETFKKDDLKVIRTGKGIIDVERKIAKKELNHSKHKNNSDNVNIEYIWISVSKTPIYDKAGKIIGILGIYEDISKQKEKITTLVKEKETADNTARARSDFLANMSHEIRTPMNGIIGLAQLALNYDISPNIRDYLSKILISSQSLLGILNDILDLSKVEANKMDLESIPFNLENTLIVIKNLFEAKIQTKHLDFLIDYDHTIPKSLYGDPLRLQQIISNLVGNSIKFTEHGFIKLTAKTKKLNTDSITISFSIQDTGIGMEESFKDRMFQPFTQTSGETFRKYGGTGLGLSISNKLLNLMGGNFDVRSQVGMGTIFLFEITFQIDHENQAKIELQSTDKGSLEKILTTSESNIIGAKILIAEDDVVNQQVISELLRISKANITLVSNGKEAYELAISNKYDAILMDVHMPIMNGLDATNKIITHPSYNNTPIIALTAGVTPQEQAICKEKGMLDFLAKPINPKLLISTLSKYVQTKTKKPSNKTKQATVSSVKNNTIITWEMAKEIIPELNIEAVKETLSDNPDFFLIVIESFIKSYSSIWNDVMDSIKINDLIQAQLLVHKFKGSSGNLGFSSTYELSKKYDELLKNGNFDKEMHLSWANSAKLTIKQSKMFYKKYKQ